MSTSILVGTCAYADHQDFYPPWLKPADRLRYYAAFFPIVEIDATFYGPLSADAFRRQARATPSSFRFGVKAYRSLTLHDLRHPPFPWRQAVVDRFLESVKPLVEEAKLLFLLFQFPPWFTHGQDARNYLRALSRLSVDYPVAVEFRHVSWWRGAAWAETARLLRDLGFIHVVADEPAVGTGHVPLVPLVTNPHLAVLRLHGRNRDTWAKGGWASSGERFRYRYGKDELKGVLALAERLGQEAGTVAVLFNNNYRNYAVQNALELLSFLKGQEFSPVLFPTPDEPPRP